MRYEDISISPLPRHRYIVNDDIHYRGITVPSGYKTNGADIPRILWIFFPPNMSDLMPAVIVHDYLCDLEQYTLADTYFNDILIELGVKSWIRATLVFATKSYHKIKYSSHSYCK